MSQVATMSVKLDADIVQWEKNLDRADKAFLKSAKNIEKAGKEMSLMLTAPLLASSAAMLKFAADDEAAMKRFTRVFGPATDAMKQFETQILTTIPSTEGEMDKLLATTMNFVEQLGIAPAKAVGLTQSLTQMAGDIAAFNGVGIDDAMDAVEKGIAGKTRGLVALGITINAQMVKEEAYRLGLAKTGSELTQTATAEATLALIRAKASNQMGEAARTAGDAANAMKFLRAETEEMLGAWGKDLIPTATSVVHSLTNVAHWLGEVPTAGKQTILVIGGIAASVGPALVAFGMLSRSLLAVRETMALVTGIEGLGLLAAGGWVAAVVLGIAAIATWLYQSGDDARYAAAQTDAYKTSLIGLGGIDLGRKFMEAQSGVATASAALAAAKAAGPTKTLTAPAGPGGLPAVTYDNSNITNAERDLAGAQARVAIIQKAYNDYVKLAYAPGMNVGADTGKTAADKQADVVAALARQVEDIAKLGAPLPATARDAYSAIGDALATLAKLGDEFHRQKGESGADFKARVDGIHQLQEALGKLTEIKIPELKLPDVVAQVDAWLSGTVERASKVALDAVPKEQLKNALLTPLQNAVDAAAVQMARLSIENAGREAHGQAPVDIDKAMVQARKTITDMGVDLKRAVDSIDLPGTPTQALAAKKLLLEQIDKLLKSIGATSPKSAVDNLAGALTTLGSGLHGLADAANALGQKDLGNLLNSAGNLATNASAFKTATDTTGQITAGFGMLGSGIAILSTIFSNDSELHRETIQIMRQNNQRLQDVAFRLSGFISSASNQDKVAAFMRDTNVYKGLQTFSFFGLDAQLKLVNPGLQKFGLTIAQVEQVAKDLGFTITNADGTLNQAGWDAFRQGIADATQAVFTFGAALSDQRSYLELRDKLSGKTTPQDDLNRSIAIIKTMAPKLLPAVTDTTTQAGRDAIRAALLSDVDRAKAGQIPLADFGNFQNLNDFISATSTAADGLNALDTATNNAVAALTNVPSGFKIALDRFIATVPTVPTVPTIPGVPPAVPGVDTFGPIVLPTPTTPMYPTSYPSQSTSASAPITFGDIITNVTIPEGVTDPDAIAASVTKQVLAQVVPQVATLLQQQAARGGASSFAVASRQLAV